MSVGFGSSSEHESLEASLNAARERELIKTGVLCCTDYALPCSISVVRFRLLETVTQRRHKVRVFTAACKVWISYNFTG